MLAPDRNAVKKEAVTLRARIEGAMDASELRARARQEADELGPEPPGPEADLWREERWGAVVPLAGLADDEVELLCQAANETATEWTDREAARLLLDAATLAEIGA